MKFHAIGTISKTAAALLMAGLCVGVASGASFEFATPAGNTVHILPAVGSPGPVTTTLNMVYGGGPVMKSPINYLIFWQPPTRSAFPAGYQAGIEKFFQDISGTPMYNIVTQYPDTVGPPSGTTTWGGSWVDTTTVAPSGCNGSPVFNPVPNCPLTDGDIQAEVNAAIAANGGWAPPGINVEYYVFTPSDADECFNNTTCFAFTGGPARVYCAYHTFFNGNKIYSYMPFAASGSCFTTSVFPNSKPLDVVLTATSHEMFESNTDPLLNGWKGPGGLDDEIGDKCAYQYGLIVPDGTNVVLNGDRYQIQTEWSNAVTGCTKRYGPTDTLSIPTNLNFGNVPIGTTTSQNLNITNTGAGDANILYIRKGPATDTAYSLTNVPPTWATIKNPNTLAVNVQIAPLAPTRTATGTVIVDTDETPCDAGTTCFTSSKEIVNNLTANVVNAPAVLPPSISKAFGAASIQLGATTSLTFTIKNPNAGTAFTGLAFSDTLPAGLVVATPNGLTNTCNGTPSATAAGSSISLTLGTLAANAQCALAVNVTSTALGLITNVSGNVSSIEGGTGNTATASINVIPVPPVLTDSVLISYAANLKSGDSKVNITNAGTDGGNDATDSICANVYVFAEDQQLISCCTCPLTPNHLRTLSVNNDLINNTLTPGVPIGVTTMLVATEGPRCDAATVKPGTTVAGLRAWSTTLHAAPGGGFAVTEIHFRRTGLSASELDKMTSLCGFIKADGSKYGICNTCQDGAAGAQKQ